MSASYVHLRTTSQSRSARTRLSFGISMSVSINVCYKCKHTCKYMCKCKMLGFWSISAGSSVSVSTRIGISASLRCSESEGWVKVQVLLFIPHGGACVVAVEAAASAATGICTLTYAQTCRLCVYLYSYIYSYICMYTYLDSGTRVVAVERAAGAAAYRGGDGGDARTLPGIS